MDPPHQDDWWRVMCLTGLDYFSTIGYQPGIAFLAAGALSPFATLVLVLVTLLGAVPVYMQVARRSPFGQGSIYMLERLLPGWVGKAFVLVLLGFAATDFVITMTLSAADATTHIINNPLTPLWMHDQVVVTVILLLILGGVFLMGFKEAILVAVVLVTSYLILNTVLLVPCTLELTKHPEYIARWWQGLFDRYHSVWHMLGISVFVFPSLALGLSGFETGVAVMPLIKGDSSDDPQQPAAKIKNTGKLLLCAAAIMTLLLVTSSFVSTVLIPAPLFEAGGKANGRAMAYLAHEYAGTGFGTVYDISTVLMLWFSGASTMAALLSLIPRYLPRYGMAPDWATAVRPLVVVITTINIAVTLFFHANVDAQAGAFATGLLVLFTSAALAVTLSMWNQGVGARIYYVGILVVFIYTSVLNMVQRPEGLHISLLFIALIVTTSLVSRMVRSTELRITSVHFDANAEAFVKAMTREHWGEVRILAHQPEDSDLAKREHAYRRKHSIQQEEGEFIFLQVARGDASEFAEDVLEVSGHMVGNYRVLTCTSPAIPNAIAAVLLHARELTGRVPHVYLSWTEGHPVAYVLRYIFWGDGETAPVTREILRSVEPDESRRPIVHVA